MAEFRLTPAAERDLEGIWRYTCARWGTDQAIRYTDDLIHTFAVLADSPLLAQACHFLRPGYRRKRMGHHVIYLMPVSHGVDIVRILHVRMMPGRHL